MFAALLHCMTGRFIILIISGVAEGGVRVNGLGEGRKVRHRTYSTGAARQIAWHIISQRSDPLIPT